MYGSDVELESHSVQESNLSPHV